MGRNYTKEALAQLNYGAGQTISGDGALIMFKALLESGVAYLGGYPGAPASSLYDAITDAYHEYLEPQGIYFEGSGNEAAAAALLQTSVLYPIRGSVNWKVVGNNVAADALAHIGATGVMGGALIVVGEDYGMNSTTVAEKTLPYALKSSLLLIDPRGDGETMARMVREGFAISEYAGAPAMYLMRTRTGSMRTSATCLDNAHPPINMIDKFDTLNKDVTKVAAPPFSIRQEVVKFDERIPRAQEYISEHELNDRFLPVGGQPGSVGIITQGMIYNTTMRALYALGEADLLGNSSIDTLCLNVIFPLVPKEIADFLRGKSDVIIVEEGMPNILEDQIRAIAQQQEIPVKIWGKDLLPKAGEYTPQVLIKGLGDFLTRRIYTEGQHKQDIEGVTLALGQHINRSATHLKQGLANRPPLFCTGCPERPIYSALKMLEGKYGQAYYAGDIGCYTMGAYAPFNMSDSITGMGTGLASAGALSRMTTKRVISFIGDGTFWHSGLTTSFANATYNNQDGVMVVFENGWTSMTGQQENPNTDINQRGEKPAGGKMRIQRVLEAMGIGHVRRVNPYSLHDSLKTFEEAFESKEKGLKVVISDAECQLEKTRHEKEEKKAKLAKGQTVVESKFGIDEDVCTGDKSCIRLNGCPSLTMKDNPNPIRDDTVATIANSCVGCGLCGEVTHAAVLCPSFYETTVVTNPSRAKRLSAKVNRALMKAVFGVTV